MGSVWDRHVMVKITLLMTLTNVFSHHGAFYYGSLDEEKVDTTDTRQL